MDKKKMIYIGSLLILTAIISIASFSYAIWSNKSEQRGKLNIVAGRLNYELVSPDLTNNSITIPANTSKTIEIEIKSLNNIESKYELYYTTNNENISIGYSEETIDNPTGTMSSQSSKKVMVIIKNKSNSTATITFGTQGGFSNKELVLAQGNSLDQVKLCLVGETWEFPFDPDGDGEGQSQVFNAACDGYYKLETWGAQGGLAPNTDNANNFGGYSVGSISLNSEETIYAIVGGHGQYYQKNSTISYGGYNGGGNGGTGEQGGSGGGGATHFSKSNHLLSTLSGATSDILIVSGGGGGTTALSIQNGAGGGYVGNNGGYHENYPQYYATGGTQSLGGIDSAEGTTRATFGKGGSYFTRYGGNGGGGGYYGGGGSSRSHSGAGGGSGYIANSNLKNKSMYCYNCTEDLTNTNTFTVRTNGTSSYRDTVNCPNGYSNDPVSKCAKAGNGYARITYLGEGNVTTLYSAAVDEVYYYDSNNNKQVIGTTDSTGKLENIFIQKGVTLYSSKAKDLTDSTQPYSKTFTNIGSEIYLMPDGKILYWYGYRDSSLVFASSETGWSVPTYFSMMSTSLYRYNTNDITITNCNTNGTLSCLGGLTTNSPTSFNKIGAVMAINSSTQYSGLSDMNGKTMPQYQRPDLGNYRGSTFYGSIDTANTITTILSDAEATNRYPILTVNGGYFTNANIYALWIVQ